MSLDGVLLIDKVSGPTSHDVVDEVRKILNIKAVGHGGTLDPLATGLLICLVGEATKLSQYVMGEDKTYIVEVKLGVRTDSGDTTGQVVAEGDVAPVTSEAISEILGSLQGKLELQVPKYSAVKVKGKKLYEYARDNADVEVPTKVMSIHRVNMLGFEAPFARFEIECEKGTYIRSWVEELGKRLGCGATVSSLRRTRSGGFLISQAATTEVLKEGALQKLIPLQDVLSLWPALKVQGKDQALMTHGQIPKGVFGQILHFDFKSGIRILNEDGGLLALIVRDPEKGIKLGRVFLNQTSPKVDRAAQI